MAFDQATRNRLDNLVSDIRSLLTEEYEQQLQGVYGMDPSSGIVTDMSKLTHLSDKERETARLLRETAEHYTAVLPSRSKESIKEVLRRIVHEQAFTFLNRVCAVKLAEARGLCIESVSKYTQSTGFQLYMTLVGTALGESAAAYGVFLRSVFDEFAADLRVLFDRYGIEGLLFPGEGAVAKVLELINAEALSALWGEDETIGWIYQYFNSKAERKAMRDASQAPRNSRELAVRNQFFTPRYVVEFLTDNTLGRIWYEMKQGMTSLKDSCRYLVRRPDEVFLGHLTGEEEEFVQKETVIAAKMLQEGTEESFPPFTEAKPDIDRIIQMAHTVNGYARHPFEDTVDGEWWPEWKKHELEKAGSFEGVCTQDLLDILFAEARHDRHGGGFGDIFIEEPILLDMAKEVRRRVVEGHREDLSQEELLRSPVFVPYRKKKDPRDLRILDPACGSGHFLLYAFDLLEKIYIEAWEDKESAESEVTGKRLRDDYSSREELLKFIPKLIVEHNLHGIDIDARAVQIAALALWLRAQRAWKVLGIEASARPVITRSNVVTAEPMPGEEDMRKEFTASLQPRVLGQIVDVVFEKMKLAGEAGSLLKIEEEIKDTIEKAKKQWMEGSKPEQLLMFPEMEQRKPIQGELRFDVKGVSDELFWEQAEDRILLALKQFAEQAENGHTVKRRLFSEDVARGFAFIDLCRKRYDVVLMNPPFGEYSEKIAPYLENSYKYCLKNLLCLFISRFIDVSCLVGLIGVIFDRTAAIKSSYEEFRKNILNERIHTVADTGWNVLDAEVETTTYVLQKKSKNTQSEFFDVRNQGNIEKSINLLKMVKNVSNSIINDNVYITFPESFQKLPNAVVGYYFDELLLRLFLLNKNISENGFQARKGHDFVSENHFRLFWEITSENRNRSKRSFTNLYNGGRFSMFFIPIRDVTLYGPEGLFVRYHPSTLLRNKNYQLKSGVGYGKRGEFLDAHILCAGVFFTSEGLAITDIDEASTYLCLSYLNSSLAQYIINQYSGQHKQVGYVNLLPYPKFSSSEENILIENCKKIIHIKKKWYFFDETTLEFSCLFFNIADFTNNTSLKATVLGLLESYKSDTNDLRAKIEINDNAVSNTIKISAKQKYRINEFIKKRPEDYPWPDMESDAGNKNLLLFSIKEIFSHLVGIVCFRWDVRFALNPFLIPKFSNPFAPLPVCAPGMLIGPDGLPAEPNGIVSEEWLRARPDANTLPPEGAVKNPTIPDSEYPIRVNWNGILVDDPGPGEARLHQDDIVRRVREVLDVIWKEKATDIEQEACDILGVKTLRDYFGKPGGFFADHLKRYSKSRRKAPIYWPLSTTSGAYTIWLYYHRLTDQTLYAVVNDYVDKKIEEARQESKRLKTKPNRTKNEQKEYEYWTDLEPELVEFREELLHLAKLWKPNLNDGVQITAAPLWRLFAFKPWQKILKETWEKLEAGEYDWAHLAYSLWPERVKEKCRKDKSLAIAHDLEELYDKAR